MKKTKRPQEVVQHFDPADVGSNPSGGTAATRRRSKPAAKSPYINLKKGIIRMTTQALLVTALAATIGMTAPVTGLAETTPSIDNVKRQVEEAYTEDQEPTILDKGVGFLNMAGTAISGKISALRDPDGKLVEIKLENQELLRKVANLQREASKRRVLEIVNYDQASECIRVLSKTLDNHKPSMLDQYIQEVEGGK